MEHGEADERLVRALLHEQRPHLAELPLRHVAAGLDNGIWRLGDDLSVRLPRTPHAVSLLRNEQRWLPVLTPHLPLPVPTSVHDGTPSARFPRPWTITTWITGEPADRSPISRGHRAADELADFLRALHRNAPANPPTSPKRGVALSGLTERFDERLRAVATSGVPAEVEDIWADAVAAPTWEGPPIWLHADLHPANVVVSGGALAGVLDFGDSAQATRQRTLQPRGCCCPPSRSHDSSMPMRTRTRRRSGAHGVGPSCSACRSSASASYRSGTYRTGNMRAAQPCPECWHQTDGRHARTRIS
ncbi:aminoglycoside phosphotransferase family protein [Spirillospora sp. NPDC050679]